MSDTTSPMMQFARAANAVMSDEDTPAIVRNCFRHYISELRDALPLDAARRIDGIEAEAVINSFVSDVLLRSEDSPQSSCQNSHEQPAIWVNTGG